MSHKRSPDAKADGEDICCEADVPNDKVPNAEVDGEGAWLPAQFDTTRIKCTSL